MSFLKDVLAKKKVTLKDKATFNKVTLKLDKDLILDEDAFAKALFIKVPNVVGMSISDAVAFLKSKNINFKLIGKEVVPRQGSVYKQYPEAGGALGLKDELQVYVNDNLHM